MVELSVENLVDMMAEQTVALTVVTKADLMVVERVALTVDKTVG